VARRTSLVEVVTERLLERVVSGEFPEGVALPPEAVLAQESGASRLTVREAVKVLASQGVLQPVQGRGTYVSPADRWTSVEALVRLHRGDAAYAIEQLVEVRTMIEVGAAELFARHGTEEDLTAMAEDLDRMRAAHAAGAVDDFVTADISFHDRVLQGCGNPFVRATFRPISRALHDARLRTSEVPVIREHALAEHESILTALRDRSAPAAGDAMRSHLDQTRDDAHQYLTSPAGDAGPTT
jgi:DNA-binding FadR family transcriptional regulator